MENVNANEKRNSQVVSSFSKKLFLKTSFIGLLIILLFIPTFKVGSLVTERKETAREAKGMVYKQWGSEQEVTAPIIQLTRVVKGHYSNVHLLPNVVSIEGNVEKKDLKRGIYDIVTYNAPISIKGDFLFSESELAMFSDCLSMPAEISICISDLKGISDEVSLKIGDANVTLMPNGDGLTLESRKMSARIDMKNLSAGVSLPFELTLNLKGSESLKFVPIAKKTSVHLTSNCSTPSFCGEFLPDHREVTANGFDSDWSISYINRNYPQIIDEGQKADGYRWDISRSAFGVDLLVPVQHYQKVTRCVKYEVLFVFLTFALFFFIEMIQKKRIHPIQYTLVGLALVLFYSLLLSFSEHIGFTPAYVVASLMTIMLLTFYTMAILKIRKTAICIGCALLGLYAYIFVLIQMETYALLAGSLGLFAILASLMYFSQKINWNAEIYD